MDFLCEDMGRVAKLRVDAKNIEFKGIEPKNLGSIKVAQVGKAKVVAIAGVTQEQLLMQLKDEEFCKATQNAWVLVVRDSEFCDEFAKIAHPYVVIVKELEDEGIRGLEDNSRGWNVENEGGEHVSKKSIVIGRDANAVEVLFGESRENPIGLLSVKCL